MLDDIFYILLMQYCNIFCVGFGFCVCIVIFSETIGQENACKMENKISQLSKISTDESPVFCICEWTQSGENMIYIHICDVILYFA